MRSITEEVINFLHVTQTQNGEGKNNERKRYGPSVNQVRKSVSCLHVEITTSSDRQTVGVTWLITCVCVCVCVCVRARTKSSMGITNFNLRWSRLERGGRLI